MHPFSCVLQRRPLWPLCTHVCSFCLSLFFIPRCALYLHRIHIILFSLNPALLSWSWPCVSVCVKERKKGKKKNLNRCTHYNIEYEYVYIYFFFLHNATQFYSLHTPLHRFFHEWGATCGGTKRGGKPTRRRRPKEKRETDSTRHPSIRAGCCG